MSEEGATKSEQRQGHDDGLFVYKALSTTSFIMKCACTFYRSHAGYFWQNIASPMTVSILTAQIWFPETSGFSQSYNCR